MPAQTQRVPSPPRVVAISGIIFSVLYIVSLVLIRLAVPADPTEPGLWLHHPLEPWQSVNKRLKIVNYSPPVPGPRIVPRSDASLHT